MTTKKAKKPLKANDQNMALVMLLGNFVVAWSIFDQLIEVAIMKHLKISRRKAAIVLSGLGFERKVSILRSLINDSPKPNKNAIALIGKIMTAARRNVLLHASVWVGHDVMEFYKMDTDHKLTVKHVRMDLNNFPTILWGITEDIELLRAEFGISQTELDSIAKIGKSLAAKSATSPSPPSNNSLRLRPRQSR